MEISTGLIKKIMFGIVGIGLVAGLVLYSQTRTSTTEVKEATTKQDLVKAAPEATGPIAEIVRSPENGKKVTIEGSITTFPDSDSLAVTQNNATVIVNKKKADDSLQVGDRVLVTGTVVSDGATVSVDADDVIVVTPTPVLSPVPTISPDDEATPSVTLLPSSSVTPAPTTVATPTNTPTPSPTSTPTPTPTPAFSLEETEVRQIATQHTVDGTVLSVDQQDLEGYIWQASMQMPDSSIRNLVIQVQGKVVLVTEDE